MTKILTSTLTSTLTLMTVTATGCASELKKDNSFQGRIIEFKSGPEGFDTKTFFYEAAEEVIAFDAQFTPELAKKSIAHLRTLTQKPLTWLVITHPNPDKFNGASVFNDAGAKIISSTKTSNDIPGVHSYKEYFFVEMAKMFKKGKYPQPILVDQTFDGHFDLFLKGGDKVELRELSSPGVSTTQTVAYLPAVNALVVGDLVHHKVHAWLEGGIVNGKATPTLDGWKADLNELLSIYPTTATVFGGRGQHANLKTVVKAQIDYLDDAINLVDKLLGASPKEIAQNFEQKFPDYELPYMIEYGAYGLVQQRLEMKSTLNK